MQLTQRDDLQVFCFAALPGLIEIIARIVTTNLIGMDF